MGVLYIFSVIGALLGGVVLVFTFLLSSGAPQQAAGAAAAAALAVVPYVLARSVQIVATDKRQKQHEQRVRELLDRVADAVGEKK